MVQKLSDIAGYYDCATSGVEFDKNICDPVGYSWVPGSLAERDLGCVYWRN